MQMKHTSFLILRQHRTIRQAASTRDFSSRQGLKGAGILCVFQAFQTAELAEKIRRSAKMQLCGAALILVLALLCACSPAQVPSVPTEPQPAASASVPEAPEPAAPASAPDVPETQETAQEPDSAPEPEPEEAHDAPDQVLSSGSYTAAVYCRSLRQEDCRIECREYVVSDGVTATAFRAEGTGDSRFFDRTVENRGGEISGIIISSPPIGAAPHLVRAPSLPRSPL